MIAVDTNILVFAHRSDSTFHIAAPAAVKGLAEGRAPWSIPPCLHEFLAVVTHRSIYDPPTPSSTPLPKVAAWPGSPSLALLSEGPSHWPILSTFVSAGDVTGPRVHDARVAALCETAGVRELWSADRDLGRFRIRTRNPRVT